jgi:hypothetical protein
VCSVRQVKDDTGVWLGASISRELSREIYCSVEVQASIIVDINVQCFEISRSVDQSDVTCLDEVVGNNNVLLVRCDLDVMGTDSGLDYIGVIKSLDIVEIGDVQSSDVVRSCKGQVDEVSVLGDIGTEMFVRLSAEEN